MAVLMSVLLRMLLSRLAICVFITREACRRLIYRKTLLPIDVGNDALKVRAGGPPGDQSHVAPKG
jgi:hypothetical protein